MILCIPMPAVRGVSVLCDLAGQTKPACLVIPAEPCFPQALQHSLQRCGLPRAGRAQNRKSERWPDSWDPARRWQSLAPGHPLVCPFCQHLREEFLSRVQCLRGRVEIRWSSRHLGVECSAELRQATPQLRNDPRFRAREVRLLQGASR